MFLTVIMFYKQLAKFGIDFRLTRGRKAKNEKTSTLVLTQTTINLVTFRNSFNPSGP